MKIAKTEVTTTCRTPFEAGTLVVDEPVAARVRLGRIVGELYSRGRMSMATGEPKRSRP